MPRLLSIDPRVPTLYGVLIPRQAVEEQLRAYTTIQQAQTYAKSIVADAQRKATDLERHALREGFQAGWVASLNGIFKALKSSNELHRQIEDALKQSVRKSLEMSLQHPGLELQLLEAWLESGPSLARELQVILPHHAQDQIESLKRRIEKVTGVESTVSIGEGRNVVIQSGDQVYEFSPERTFEELSGLVDRCFQTMEVRRMCEKWSSQIVRNWLDEIDQNYRGIVTDQNDSEDPMGDDDFENIDSESTLNFFRT